MTHESSFPIIRVVPALVKNATTFKRMEESGGEETSAKSVGKH